jgi:hypothetical protein
MASEIELVKNAIFHFIIKSSQRRIYYEWGHKLRQAT